MFDLEELDVLDRQLRMREERREATMRVTQATFAVVAKTRELIEGSRELLNEPLRS